MKETKSYLKNRWKTDLKSLNDFVTCELKNEVDLSKVDLPKTTEGLLDLRGFSAPKKYTSVKSNAGRNKTYVSEGIRIKKMSFENFDFSYSDFEACDFFNCRFSNSKFNEARFVATNYWGCKFHNINFTKTNFGQSTFRSEGIIFKKIINSFKDVTFKDANLSEVNVYDQKFERCQIADCKTGRLILSKCVLQDLSFSGPVKNLFLIKSRKVENVDFTNALVIGIHFENQTLNGFHFPKGDNYYMFKSKSKELACLKIQDQLTDGDRKIVDSLRFIWSRNNLEVDFVDVNWLKTDEISIGKLVIEELKKGNKRN